MSSSYLLLNVYFFFSSRRRHTRYWRDWSSDVCSSDLAKGGIYRSPESFARLYGLTRKQYRELKPYIVIGDDYLPASTLASVAAWHENRVAERQKEIGRAHV